MILSTQPISSTFTDAVEDAVMQWQDGQESLFNFAITCNEIVGLRNGETARLAKRIKRDSSTVELYAKGGGLWLAMLEQYPSEAELLRDRLQISFWNAAGSKVPKLMSVDNAKAALEHALEEGWTVDKFRAMLPVHKVGDSPFKRAIKKIVASFEKDILNAPALDSGMNDAEYKRFVKFAKAFVWMAKKFTEGE
jgi:hypothetical protein